MNLVITGNEPRQRYLFAELGRQATVVADLPFDHIDPVTKYLAAALSFATPREEWWGNYHMHPLMQRRRRRVLARGLARLDSSVDALLMYGSWFNPFPGRANHLRFYNYIDQSRSLQPLPGERTTHLSRRRRSYDLQVETYRQSSGVLCWSEWCHAQTLEAHPAIDQAKVHTVGWGPCGVDLSAEEIPESGRSPLVLHVSNDFYRKGVDYLVETATLVRSAVPDARFVVVGGDTSGMVLPPTDQVEFTGRINDKAALADYFRKAALFFLPHRFDRSPHVLAEAMSAGLPIVTSEQGGPIEVLNGTGVGLINRVGDVRGYADSIIELLRNDARRREMGVRAKALMQRKYNWPAVARNILGVMQKA